MIIYYYNILLFIGATIILFKLTEEVIKKTLGKVDKQKAMNYQKQLMKTSFNVTRQKTNFTELVTYAGTNTDAYKEVIKLFVSYFIPFITFIIPMEIIMKGNPLAKIRGFEITWVTILLIILAGAIIIKVTKYLKEKRKNQ